MNKYLLLAGLIFLIGCSSYGQDYLGHPSSIIKDPHFTQYKKSRDNLESAYLRKEITYAEYVQQRDKLDDQYDSEVQKRNAIISEE